MVITSIKPQYKILLLKSRGDLHQHQMMKDLSELPIFQKEPALVDGEVKRTFVTAVFEDGKKEKFAFKGSKYDINKIPCHAIGLLFEFEVYYQDSKMTDPPSFYIKNE